MESTFETLATTPKSVVPQHANHHTRMSSWTRKSAHKGLGEALTPFPGEASQIRKLRPTRLVLVSFLSHLLV
jgi:hypothetical protein